jgi:hypothetical protein
MAFGLAEFGGEEDLDEVPGDRGTTVRPPMQRMFM